MSKRKKHNMQKRMQKLAQSSVKGLMVCFVMSHNVYAQLIDVKTQRVVKPTRLLDISIRQTPHDWSVLACVFCETEAGERYVKSIVMRVERPCVQRELDSIASKQHVELVRGCNDNHVVGVGWLATPYAYHFDDDFEVYEAILEKYGAWTEVSESQLLA